MKVSETKADPSSNLDQPEVTAETSGCGCASYKQTPRQAQLKKSTINRLNRAIGQLNGVKNMISEDRYCGDVLTQLAAANSAIKAVSRQLMQDHLETCVIEKIQAGQTEVVDELMSLFKKFT